MKSAVTHHPLRPALALALLWLAPAWAASAGLDPVRLQLKWQHQFQFAGYYAAKEKGYYRDAGLDVTLLPARPGIDPTAEVLAGRAEFGIGTSELILHRFRGEPVVVLGVIFQHSPLNLVTLADTGLDHVHKLAGRRLMIEPDSAELFAYLQKEGVPPTAFEAVPHHGDLDDLITGRVSAASVYSTDELYTLEQKNIGYQRFTPRMGGIDFYGDNFFTLAQQIETRPERVRAFRDATVRGWKYAMQHPEEMIALIQAKYSRRHSAGHLRFEAAAMRDLMQPELIEPGYMHIGRWQHIAKTYHEIGLLPEQFDVAPMLYAKDGDRAHLERQLLFALGGLLVMGLVFIALLRGYQLTRANKERLHTIFTHAPLGLIVIDRELRIRKWNKAAEQTFQWSAREAVGRDVLELLVPDDHKPQVRAILDRVHQQQTTVSTENPNLRRNGESILCEWINAPFKDTHDHSTHIICMARDVTRQRQVEEQLQRAAHYDTLTGLPNRALILELLRSVLSVSKRSGNKFAVLFVDLNDFKAVNDTRGHQTGDELLKTVAERLPRGLRESDHVGRLGGDEFLVILRDVETHQQGEKLAQALRERLRQPCVIQGEALQVDASVGLALYPDDSSELDELLNTADHRMYAAKAGRGV